MCGCPKLIIQEAKEGASRVTWSSSREKIGGIRTLGSIQLQVIKTLIDNSHDVRGGGYIGQGKVGNNIGFVELLSTMVGMMTILMRMHTRRVGITITFTIMTITCKDVLDYSCDHHNHGRGHCQTHAPFPKGKRK